MNSEMVAMALPSIQTVQQDKRSMWPNPGPGVGMSHTGTLRGPGSQDTMDNQSQHEVRTTPAKYCR